MALVLKEEAVDSPAKVPHSICSLQMGKAMNTYSNVSRACQPKITLFCYPLANVSFPGQSVLQQALAVAVQIRAVRDADKAASGVL